MKTTNSTTEQTEIENIKSTERQKTSFLKEYVDNRDLFKLVLNKIMTPHEKSVKGNFATPISFLVLIFLFVLFLRESLYLGIIKVIFQRGSRAFVVFCQAKKRSQLHFSSRNRID